MSKQKKRNIIIYSLCAVLLLMTAGYAAFNTLLNINGTTSITSNWDIKITSITSKDIVGKASDEDSQVVDDLKATFKANLVSPGDSITYDITVENKGNVNAQLDSIDVSESDNENIKIVTSGITEGDTLNASSTATLSVKVTYSDEVTTQPDNLKAEVTITLDYVQEGMRPQLPETINLETDITTNSITLTATKISGATYEFKKDNDDYINNGKNNVYTFNEIAHNTSHNFQVKVTKGGKTLESESSPIKTNNLEAPVVSVSGTSGYITFPIGCTDGRYKCWYEWSGGATGKVEVTKTSETFSGSPNNVITAYVSDGYNEVHAFGTLTGACFVGGTKVLTENGLKNIEDIKVGEKVYSYNEKSKKTELKEIEEVYINKSAEIITIKYEKNNKMNSNLVSHINNIGSHYNSNDLTEANELKCTHEHPFYVVGKGWTKAEEIKKGDKILTIDGSEVIITNVQSNFVNTTKVYNLSVKDNHSYYVSKFGVLTHNKSACTYMTGAAEWRLLTYGISTDTA